MPPSFEQLFGQRAAAESMKAMAAGMAPPGTPAAEPPSVRPSPAPNPTKEASGGWQGFLNGVKKDPNALGFLFAMGQALSGPRQPGENPAAQIGRSMANGFQLMGYMASARQARQKEEDEKTQRNRQIAVQERGVAATEEATKATIARGQEQTALQSEQLELSREELANQRAYQEGQLTAQQAQTSLMKNRLAADLKQLDVALEGARNEAVDKAQQRKLDSMKQMLGSVNDIMTRANEAGLPPEAFKSTMANAMQEISLTMRSAGIDVPEYRIMADEAPPGQKVPPAAPGAPAPAVPPADSNAPIPVSGQAPPDLSPEDRRAAIEAKVMASPGGQAVSKGIGTAREGIQNVIDMLSGDKPMPTEPMQSPPSEVTTGGFAANMEVEESIAKELARMSVLLSRDPTNPDLQYEMSRLALLRSQLPKKPPVTTVP